MKKFLFLTLICLPFLNSCGNGCDGMGAGYDKSNKTTIVEFKDTTNGFISITFPLQNIKYYYHDTINTQVRSIIDWNDEIKLLTGQKPITSIIIEHKKGIDTIAFEFIRTKPKYEVDGCDKSTINFNYEGPFIKSYTFDSVYFKGEHLILE